MRFDKYARAGAFGWKLAEGDEFYKIRLQAVLRNVRPRSTCLDLGCGDGAIAGAVARIARSVTGIDQEKLATKLARRELAGRGIENVEILWSSIGDAAGRIQRGAFDLVYSMDVIEHMERPGELLKLAEIAMRKSTGRFLLGTPLFRGPENVSPYHFREYSLTELRSMVSRRFEIESVSLLPDRLRDRTVDPERFAVIRLR